MNINKSSIANICLDECFLFLFILSVFFVPHVASIIHMSIFVAWLFLASLRNVDTVVRAVFCKRMVAAYLFLAMFFMAALLEEGKNGLTYAISSTMTQLMYIVSGVIMFEFYQNQNDMKKNKVIAFLCVVIILITQIAFLVLYNIHSISARHFVAGESWEQYSDIYLASPYGIIVAGTLITVALIYCNFDKAKIDDRKKRIFSTVAVLLLSLNFVIASESTISILIFVAGIGIALIFAVSQKTVNVLFSAVFLFFLIMLFFLNLEDIASYLISFEYSGLVGEKFAAIGKLLIGNADGDSHVIGRLDVYSIGFEAIKKNWLYGNAFEHGVSYSAIYTSGHSEILDTISRFGIIGGGAYLIHLLNFSKRIFCITTSRASIACCIVFLLYAILNQIYYMSAWFSFFFVCPMLIMSLKKEGLEGKI